MCKSKNTNKKLYFVSKNEVIECYNYCKYTTCVHFGGKIQLTTISSAVKSNRFEYEHIL